MLENLYRNAIEHGTRDRTDDERVTVTVGSLDDGFYVADDGSGISPEHRAQIFEPGFSTDEEGTGYGLSIVSEIVGAHGWDITVTEGADGGARFEITGLELVD